MKIGIITHYYHSRNYGGNLQAYALVNFLQKNGYEVEQISYATWERPRLFSRSFWSLQPIRKMKNIARQLLNMLGKVKHWCKTPYKAEERMVAGRKKKIETFNQQSVPHSEDVYYSHDYLRMKDHYDIFITGSDQVWSNQWGGFYPAFFLDGIKAPKVKLSYAASLGKRVWTQEELQKFESSLADYLAVSVREEDAVGILQKVVPNEMHWVVDPTLLLSRADWDKICTKRLVQEKYLFCYFLGDDPEERKLAVEYAAQHGLKVATIPFLADEWRFSKSASEREVSFGDVKLYEAGIEDFLSLIKYASCVFTDSFHAALFSGVFQREYFIFGRGEMNSRITSLTKLYETEERFCNTTEKRRLAYIQAQKPIDYMRDLKILEEMRQKSKDFLRTNLEKAEGQINGI